MASLYEQRNLSMTPANWLALEALAVQTNSRSTRGTQARCHSWRTFIERVAAGEIIIVEREPYQMPPGLDEAVRQIEHRQRIEQHEAQKQVVRKAPGKLEQLSMLELEPA
jgi:hypothetical protein